MVFRKKHIDVINFDEATSIDDDGTGFRNSKGRLITAGLFLERTTDKDKKSLRYTLRSRSVKGFPSLYEIYMSCPDEYTFALKAFNNSLHQLDKLKSEDWFMNGIKACEFDGYRVWQEHHQKKTLSNLMTSYQMLADEGNSNALSKLIDLYTKNKDELYSGIKKKTQAVSLEEDLGSIRKILNASNSKKAKS